MPYFKQVFMELTVFYRLCEAGLFVLMPICGFVLLPSIFKSYNRWHELKRPFDFSSTILQGALSLFFLSSIFPLFANEIIDLYLVCKNTIFGFIGSILLGTLVGYWTIPKTLAYYQKLKLVRSPRNFTLMAIFGFLSFYGISPLFILMLYSVIGSR